MNMETHICRNLRPYDFNDVLFQVGRSHYDATVYSDVHTGYNRLFNAMDCLMLPGNSFVKKNGILYKFISSNNTIHVAWNDSCYVLDRYPVPPMGIVASGDDIFVLLSEGYAPRKYTFTPLRKRYEWVKADDISDFPVPYSLKRVDTDLYSSAIPAISLKGDYTSRSGKLTVTDASTLGKAMGEAYCALSDKAMTARAYIQPVIARYRVRGKLGDILYTSAPVLITPDEPLQASEVVFTLSGDSFNRTSETVLTAKGFKLELSPLAPMEDVNGWNKTISSVEIFVSPQFHSYIPGVAPAHSFGMFTSASGALTVNLPGVDPSPLVAQKGSRLETRVASALSRIDEVLHPYESERPDTLTEISNLRKLLSDSLHEVGADSRILADFIPPHGFSAECAASGGDVIMWGNLQARRFDGYSVAEIAAKIDITSGAVPAASIVRFSDGSSVVNSSILSHPPLSFSPLIVYPHRDACEVEIRVGARSVKLPLSPAPGGEWSYYLSPSCLPVAFDTDTEGFVVPAASPPTIRHPDLIAVSRADDPMRLCAVARCGGKVNALTPTALPVSSWDFARANFYAFTEGGINAVTVNSRRDSLSAARIDSRCVESAEAVALTPEGVMAMASGDLVRINSNRVRTLIPSLGADRVGWSSPFGELWCVTDGDPVIQVVNADGKQLFTRDDISVAHIHTSPYGLFGKSADGELVELSWESPAESTVRYKVRLPVKPSKRRLLRLVLPVFADNASGKVVVSADFGDASSHPLATLDIQGSLAHPLVATIPTPARPFYAIDVTLTGTDISLSAPSLTPFTP